MPLSKFSNGLTKLVHREVLWAWEPVQCNCHLCIVGMNGGLTRTLHSSGNKRKILTLHLNELYPKQDWFKHNSNFPWFFSAILSGTFYSDHFSDLKLSLNHDRSGVNRSHSLLLLSVPLSSSHQLNKYNRLFSHKMRNGPGLKIIQHKFRKLLLSSILFFGMEEECDP